MDKNNSFRREIVLGGFLFIFGFLALSQVLGDSPLLKIIFIGGWLVIAGCVIKYFISNKKKD